MTNEYSYVGVAGGGQGAVIHYLQWIKRGAEQGAEARGIVGVESVRIVSTEEYKQM